MARYLPLVDAEKAYEKALSAKFTDERIWLGRGSV